MDEQRAIDLYREITGESEIRARSVYMYMDLLSKVPPSSAMLNGAKGSIRTSPTSNSRVR